MKCLHIIRSLDPELGGPIEGLRQLAHAMHAIGHQTEVATLDPSGIPWARDFDGVVHGLGPSTGFYGYSSRFVPWIRQHASDYDAIFVRGLWQYHSFGTWCALRGSKSKYFVFPHGMLDPWSKRRYPIKHLKKWLYWPWAEYRVLRDAHAVLFTSKDERMLARQSFCLYRCREVVVSYGTAASVGDPNVQKEVLLGRHPELARRRLLLFMSRIHPKKGCDLLIRAFARVMGSDSDWRLVMAGPDQIGWKKRLVDVSRALGVSDRITWTGMLTGDAKWGLLRSAEVLVLPSHSENFGIVVAEALACSLPVLISDRVNIWREIVEERAGIAASDTLEGTESLLRRWINLDAKDRSQMRELAGRCFAKRFDIRKAASSLVELVSGAKLTPPDEHNLR
jgi:glycosyltransferase involved in cell wall biosynthesis